jgi:hypothetical protein
MIRHSTPQSLSLTSAWKELIGSNSNHYPKDLGCIKIPNIDVFVKFKQH